MKNRRSEQEWRALVQECRSSGISTKAWCEKNSIPANTFYYHIRKLRGTACKDAKNLPGSAMNLPEVVPLRILDEATAVPVPGTGNFSPHPDIIVNCQGITVSIPECASFDSVCSVMKALHILC